MVRELTTTINTHYITMQEAKLTERSYRNANQERRKIREERFNLYRQNKQQVGQFQEFDYLQYYPQHIKRSIIASLTQPIPHPLPPLDVTTISYYRRAQRPIFQTRIYGSTELDYHMTHESLHLLSMTEHTQYPNFSGLTKEFQKDLRHYLAKSNDIKKMAIIAAGNQIIGRQKDILYILSIQPSAVWVLFNHIFTSKIPYQALLPFILNGSEIAFQAFYQLSNQEKHQSISWLFDQEEVVDSILKGLQSSNTKVRTLCLRIIGNVLGEQNQQYAQALIRTNILDVLFNFLISSDTGFRKDTCWLLANFSSYESAATIILRRSLIFQKLTELLFNETSLEIRKEIAHIFNYLISLADKELVFRTIVDKNFLEAMAVYLQQQSQELTIIVLNALQGLLNLGEQFQDEQRNIVALMVSNHPDIKSQVRKGCESNNCIISSSCTDILSFLSQREVMESEL